MRARAIDAGGSVTRIARNKKDITKIPSPCMEIPVDSVAKSHIIEDKLLDFMIKESPCTSINGRRFVKSEAMNQFTGDVLVCSNQQIKVLQEITYINIFYALAADCVRRNLNDQEFSVGVCIPTAEYFDDQNDRIGTLKDNLAGDTSIYFPMLDKTIRFHIERTKIAVTGEGLVAGYKYRNDVGFVMRISVVVDIGYRSTDITVMSKFSPIGASAASRPFGGVNLEAVIQSQLERDNLFVSIDVVQSALCTNYVLNKMDELVDITDYIDKAREISEGGYLEKCLELLEMDGYDFTIEDVKTAVRSHYIVQGQDVVDITNYVHSAKEVFVDNVYKSIHSVVSAKMMNISDISNVLCIGRPFCGDPDDPYNMVNLLRKKFRDEVSMYSVPDAGTANVSEIAGLLAPDDEV